MQLHQLQPTHSQKKRKRIGRGGKRGSYSGKGIKGQLSRSGAKLAPIVRELIKRYPKLRGYKFKTQDQSRGLKSVILNLEVLDSNFKTGEEVRPAVLLEKGIINKIKGKTPKVKVLGKGELKKALTLEGCQVSQSAKEKIERAGGKVI